MNLEYIEKGYTVITDFKIPDLAENVTSGTISKVMVKTGDSVTKDQSLIELESDKATLEIPSPEAGVIKEILVEEGAEVNVGQVIMKIDSGATAKKSFTEKPSSDDHG